MVSTMEELLKKKQKNIKLIEIKLKKKKLILKFLFFSDFNFNKR
jgi:hypothetical protein